MQKWQFNDLLTTQVSQQQALALRSLMLLLGRSGKVRIGFGKTSKPLSNQTRNGIQRTTATRQLSLRKGMRNIQERLVTPAGFVGCAAKLHSTHPTQQLKMASSKRISSLAYQFKAWNLLPNNRCKGKCHNLALSPTCLPTHQHHFATYWVK